MKKITTRIIEAIKEEYRFIIFLILLYCILQIPVNYYIVTGGGTSDVSSRIQVNKAHKGKGSFNISFVTELQGTISSYVLSYIIPTWEREDANLYKYEETESIEDIEFRSNLDLKAANANATYWAYTLANKSVQETKNELYVITKTKDNKNDLQIGDRIIRLDGQFYDNIKDFRSYIQTKTETDTVEIELERKGKEKTIQASLYKEKDVLLLGVGLKYVKEYKSNPNVNIKFKKTESGPSGGLITTLEIYNQLTKKDLTKGYKIAGTGTIEENGTIGQIGGVEHKLLGAVSDKTDIFLVPSGQNYKDALKYKKDKKLKIKLIKVSTIEDAIQKLEELS